jgi:phenylacetate-CoA ligase
VSALVRGAARSILAARNPRDEDSVTLRSRFARHVALPLKSIAKREPTRRIADELERSQWLDPESLRALRERRLRHLLLEVGRDVPFYRDALRGLGADPRGDDPWQILERLPTIDKQAYREIGSALRAESPRRGPVHAFTSGTTGERLEVQIDPDSITYRYLAGFRGRRWWGFEQGDPEFKIWGSGIRTATGPAELAYKLLRRAKDWAIGITLVSPFFQDDEDLEHAARLLLRARPRLVFGYANSIHLLAAHMVRRGLQAGPGWPLAVFYTAEMLLDWQREDIARAFGAPLVAEYGSCEAGVMAVQCPEGSLHVSDDILVLETQAAPGARAASREVGEVVVTDLLATQYPLIRYRQGDLARTDAQRCACGRGLGVLRDLTGRMNERFTSPGGGIVDFIVFDQAMKEQPAIRRFKVVERQPGDLVFLAELHPGQTWDEPDRQRFLRQCGALLPADAALSTRVTERLPPEPSGKFRIMVSAAEAAKYL